MYAFLWRILPGGTAAKLLQALALAALAFWLLMYVVFPWVEPHLPLDQVVVG
ncbi:hypothetical protein [Nocardioides sp. GY 10113]|uniref:hypothetical protein n=1 Tax=Nocardioides sp. GY 10113 TaxID=2569761 RepID=UPI0014583F8A|nr:hypothetical protein [Nocardioides sp. GY 10113]